MIATAPSIKNDNFGIVISATVWNDAGFPICFAHNDNNINENADDNPVKDNVINPKIQPNCENAYGKPIWWIGWSIINDNINNIIFPINIKLT